MWSKSLAYQQPMEQNSLELHCLVRVGMSYMWPLSSYHVTSVTEELNFLLDFVLNNL